MLEKTSRDLILWFFLVLFILSFFLLGKLLWPFFSVIIMASVVTGCFFPIYVYLERKIRPSYASLLTCILIFFILFVPIVFFVGILTTEAHDLYITVRSAQIPSQMLTLFEESDLLQRVNGFLRNFNMELTYEEVVQSIVDLGKFLGLFLLNQANAIASHLFKFVIDFCLMLIVTYYLLIDGKRLIWFISDLSPLPDDQDHKVMNKFKNMAGAVIIGNGICGLFQGVVGGTVFALFGLRSPFLWGVVMGFFAFLPIVGIGIVFLPAAFYLFLKGRIAASISFIIIYGILSGGTEYLFKPALVGKRVEMHTLLVFLSIIGGLQMFGILGIIYGPLIVTFFLTLADIYNTSYRKLVTPVADTENQGSGAG